MGSDRIRPEGPGITLEDSDEAKAPRPGITYSFHLTNLIFVVPFFYSHLMDIRDRLSYLLK